MDEVERYHLKTLKMAVEDANRFVAQKEAEQQRENERRQKEIDQHEKEVKAVAKKLKFD